MSLKDDIHAKRGDAIEAQKTEALERIANSLEDIEKHLGKIQDQLFQDAAAARLPGGSSYRPR